MTIPPVIIVDTFNPVPNPVPGATLPSVTLTVPYQDPPNTFRAMTVSDMFDLAIITNVAGTGSIVGTVASSGSNVSHSFDMVYEVGIPASIAPRYVSISNLCIQNDLQVLMNMPQYIVTEAPPTFSVAAASVFNFTASFSEDAAKNMSLTSTGDFTTPISMTIYPLNVTGPVFVGIALPPAPPVSPPPAPPTVPPVPDPNNPYGNPDGGDLLGSALPPSIPGSNHTRPGIPNLNPLVPFVPPVQQ